MSGINFITDTKGIRTHILLPLNPNKKITLEYIEDIQDIIAYELLKEEKSVDYLTNIEKIINSKKNV